MDAFITVLRVLLKDEFTNVGAVLDANADAMDESEEERGEVPDDDEDDDDDIDEEQ